MDNLPPIPVGYELWGSSANQLPLFTSDKLRGMREELWQTAGFSLVRAVPFAHWAEECSANHSHDNPAPNRMSPSGKCLPSLALLCLRFLHGPQRLGFCWSSLLRVEFYSKVASVSHCITIRAAFIKLGWNGHVIICTLVSGLAFAGFREVPAGSLCQGLPRSEGRIFLLPLYGKGSQQENQLNHPWLAQSVSICMF